MKKLITILLLFPCFFISCKTNQVLVKFKNETPEKFEKLYVNILGKEFEFEDLNSGTSTRYVKVDKTYPYCFMRAITEKDTIVFLPIDYVGEQLYTNRKLIMKISLEQRADGIRSLDIKSSRPLF